MRYGHLVLYAGILLLLFAYVRPGSHAGKAGTAVTESMTGVLGKGISAVGG